MFCVFCSFLDGFMIAIPRPSPCSSVPDLRCAVLQTMSQSGILFLYYLRIQTGNGLQLPVSSEYILMAGKNEKEESSVDHRTPLKLHTVLAFEGMDCHIEEPIGHAPMPSYTRVNITTG